MRRKIGTLLEERLLERARGRAAREGKALNALLEEALEAYLARGSARSSRHLVEKGWGAFRVSRRQLNEALKHDVLDT